VANSYTTVCFNYFLIVAIFLNIDISQSSVATYLKFDGIFKYDFVKILPLSLSAKEFLSFENRLTFGEVMSKSLVSCFLTHAVVRTRL